MISSRQSSYHKQKRIGFKRPVFFYKEDENPHEEDQINITEDENKGQDGSSAELEEDQLDMSKMKIPSILESDQKLKLSSSLFDGFDWIQTEQDIFDDIDQDIQIPDNFVMPF